MPARQATDVWWADDEHPSVAELLEVSMARADAGGRSPLGVLANGQFRLLFAGTTLTMLAFGMMQVAQGVVAFELTGRNSAVGFVSLGQGLAMLTLSPLGGALSDRVSKKRLLTGSQFVIGAMFALIATLIATDRITILVLAGATLVLGCMYSLMGPARQTWVGDLLVGPTLARGVALQQLMMNATRIVGPLVAGALIAFEPVGTAGTYAVMATLFAGVVVVLARMAPTPPRPRTTPASVRADLGAGFAYLWRTPDVRLLALVFVGVVLSGFSYQTVMPGYLEHVLGRSASQLGLLFGTTAVGGIVVTLTLAARRVRHAAAVMLGFGAALAASLALLAAAPNFPVALIVAAVLGAASSGFQMLNSVNLMERTDPAFLGRVMAVSMMAFGVNAIVAYPVGAVADLVGERATLAGLAVVCLVVIAAGALALRAVLRRAPAVSPMRDPHLSSRRG
jgi:MFS family permease